MSRLLEGIFVIGCSLVGLGMNASEGSLFQNTVKSSVQFISLAQERVSYNGAWLLGPRR
jgi:hypothetical protein